MILSLKVLALASMCHGCRNREKRTMGPVDKSSKPAMFMDFEIDRSTEKVYLFGFLGNYHALEDRLSILY